MPSALFVRLDQAAQLGYYTAIPIQAH